MHCGYNKAIQWIYSFNQNQGLTIAELDTLFTEVDIVAVSLTAVWLFVNIIIGWCTIAAWSKRSLDRCIFNRDSLIEIILFKFISGGNSFLRVLFALIHRGFVTHMVSAILVNILWQLVVC